MSKNEYYGHFTGVQYEDLEAAGDGVPKFLRNVEVAEDAEIKRGMLLAASTSTGTYSLAGAGDSGKFFAVAREDFTADSDHTITQAWTMGRFHAPAVITAGGSDTSVLTSLEPELRRQNIHLVGLKEIYGNYDPWKG